MRVKILHRVIHREDVIKLGLGSTVVVVMRALIFNRTVLLVLQETRVPAAQAHVVETRSVHSPDRENIRVHVLKAMMEMEFSVMKLITVID